MVHTVMSATYYEIVCTKTTVLLNGESSPPIQTPLYDRESFCLNTRNTSVDIINMFAVQSHLFSRMLRPRLMIILITTSSCSEVMICITTRSLYKPWEITFCRFRMYRMCDMAPDFDPLSSINLWQGTWVSNRFISANWLKRNL